MIGLSNWTMMLFGRCGWNERDMRDLIGRVKEELQNPQTRSSGRVCVQLFYDPNRMSHD
jgi:hypothetical protein